MRAYAVRTAALHNQTITPLSNYIAICARENIEIDLLYIDITKSGRRCHSKKLVDDLVHQYFQYISMIFCVPNTLTPLWPQVSLSVNTTTTDNLKANGTLRTRGRLGTKIISTAKTLCLILVVIILNSDAEDEDGGSFWQDKAKLFIYNLTIFTSALNSTILTNDEKVETRGCGDLSTSSSRHDQSRTTFGYPAALVPHSS